MRSHCMTRPGVHSDSRPGQARNVSPEVGKRAEVLPKMGLTEEEKTVYLGLAVCTVHIFVGSSDNPGASR